jgi:phenylacetate-CoA ligase
MYSAAIQAFETRVKRRRTFEYFVDLKESQWWPRERLEQQQTLSLKRLLAHADANCPYYARMWRQHGVDPEIGSFRDLESFPIIDRHEINAHRPELEVRGSLQPLIRKSTGGSTGIPLHFALDNGSNDRRVAATYRGYTWAGAGPGTKQLHLWGGVLQEQTRFRRYKDLLYHRLHRRKLVDVFRAASDHVFRFWKELEAYRPRAIVAYANAIYEVARAFEEHGLRPHKPISVIVGAEKLHAFQRVVVERVFSAPVFETYGSREFMLIASECPEQHALHLTAEHLIVGIVDDAGRPVAPGVEGDVVVTDLFNYGMPFVRYRLGDRAVAEASPCACGRGLPTLARITGRRLDMLVTPAGRSVPGEFFPHLLKDFAGVRHFRVVQESPACLTLQIVPTTAWNNSQKTGIATAVGRTFGPEMLLRIETVESIPLTKAGKLEVVVNARNRITA